jgi:hypothetical protein
MIIPQCSSTERPDPSLPIKTTIIQLVNVNQLNFT